MKDIVNPFNPSKLRKWNIKIGDCHAYYCDNLLHRTDGPAIEYDNNDVENCWYIYGEKYTEEEYNRVVKLLFLI